MQALANIKVCFNKRDKCFFGKYKDPVSGNWKSKNVPVNISTETEAKDWFANFLRMLGTTNVVPVNAEVRKTVHTLETLYPLIEGYWRNTRTNKNGDKLDPQTVSDWVSKMTLHILPHPISQIPITVDTFTPVAIVDFIEHVKGKGLAKYTIKDIRFVLRTCIGDARKKGWIDLPFNPVADEIVSSEVPAGAPISGKDNPIHLSRDEARALIACPSPLIPDWRKVKNLVALTTGIRDGEIQALSWADVDLDKRFVVIDRQLKRGGKEPTFKAPKKGSNRTIPLHSLTVKALAMLKATRPNAKPTDPIFPDPATGLFARLKSADQFRFDLRMSGVSDMYQGKFPFDFHATRRTFLTLLDDAGVSEEMASAMAGHAKKGVRKHYVKDHLDKFIPAIEALPFGDLTLEWCK